MSRTSSPFPLLSDDLASLFTEKTEAKKRTSKIFYQHTCLPTHNRVFPSLLYHGHLFYCAYDLIDSSLKSCSCNSPLTQIFNIFSAQLFSSVWKHFISSNHLPWPELPSNSHSISLFPLDKKSLKELSNHSIYPFSSDHTTITFHPLYLIESCQLSVFILLTY